MDRQPKSRIDHALCQGKNTYTKLEAERVKEIVGRTRGKDVRAYECDMCFGWHLTKKNEAKKRRSGWDGL